MSVEISWLGHASVLIRSDNIVVYIDPWKTGQGLPRADIILLTHTHYDHYSEEDISRIARKGTRVLSPEPAPLVTDIVHPGESRSFEDVRIDAVPAYNIDKSFHPKANGWVGYVITMEGRRIYHTGDTDRIPEMKGLDVDVALIPVGGTYTMDPGEAAQAAVDMAAAEAIPIHFGDIVGTGQDAFAFARIVGKTARILEPGEPYTLL